MIRIATSLARVALACFAACFVLSAANAYGEAMGVDEFPTLALMVNDHGQGPPEFVNAPGLEIATNKFQYRGTHQGPGARWIVEYEIEADPDPFLNAVFTITNSLPTAQNFTLNVILPTSPPILGSSLTGGSVSGTVIDTGGGGAEFSSISGGSPPPIYWARIDGANYQSLMSAPVSITTIPYGTSGFGPAQFGAPIPSMLGPSALSNIEVEINARVSGNDTAIVVATFVVEDVPEPSTGVGLLSAAMIGLLVWWRKRAA